MALCHLFRRPQGLSLNRIEFSVTTTCGSAEFFDHTG
jgi:hypothetical protein